MEAHHHLNLHQHQQNPTLPSLHLSYAASSSPSFTFYPNPNPNPNPNPINGYSNPLPSSLFAAATTGDLPPPGVDRYLPHDPYASHLAYDGVQSIASHSYPQTAADYYYQLQQQQQFAANYVTHGVVGTGNSAATLETKRQKVIAGGAPADSVRVCTICDVVCNSDKVFALHIAGEKHALKAFGVPHNPLKQKVPAHKKALYKTNKAKIPTARVTPKTAAKKAAKRLISFVQSSYCDVCKVNCNSQEVFNNHKFGRKHLRNLQKLQEATEPKPANAPTNNPTPQPNATASQNTAPSEEPKQNSVPAPKEDLETKKQKVLTGGAAADAVRVCIYCNVVCNSQSVYNSHIAGKKHIAMMNKQQQAVPGS